MLVKVLFCPLLTSTFFHLVVSLSNLDLTLEKCILRVSEIVLMILDDL